VFHYLSDIIQDNPCRRISIAALVNVEFVGYQLTHEFKDVFREAMIKIGERNKLGPQSETEVAVMDYLKKRGMRFSNKQVIHVANIVGRVMVMEALREWIPEK
jgi:hypothetical protein